MFICALLYILLNGPMYNNRNVRYLLTKYDFMDSIYAGQVTLKNKNLEKTEPNRFALLDALRGVTALYVVIHHFFGYTNLKNVTYSAIRFPFRFGQEAVIIFFIMSGFLISVATYKANGLTWKEYFLKRFIRIYPIFISVLLLSICINTASGISLKVNDIKDFFGKLTNVTGYRQ